MQKINAEYKRLYPRTVEAWRVRFQVAMFVFLALAAIFLVFFREQIFAAGTAERDF
jgi:hypothetical protein